MILFALWMSAAVMLAQDYSYHENSQSRGIETFAERVTLDITPIRTRIAEDRETVVPAIGAIAAPLINVGLSVAKARLAKNAKQYMASYACANSGERFFESRQIVHLPQLTLKRSITIADRGSPGGMKATEALTIVLMPELSSDKRAFRYIVKEVVMGYSKARTRGKFDFIDIQLDMIFRSLSVDGAKPEVSNIRAFTLVIPAVKPNQVYDISTLPRSSWLPFPPTPQITKGVGDYNGTGMYEFQIMVTESNAYKVRAENKQFMMDKSGDSLSELAEEISKVIKTEK